MEWLKMEKFTEYIENIDWSKIIVLVIITLIGIFIIKLIRFIVKKSLEKSGTPQTKMLVSKLINYIGFGILFMIIMSELGIKLSTLLGAAGILGLAIGVASQKSLGNIISGLFMVTEKSFEIGDIIKVGELKGVVHSVELLAIMLKTFDNMLIRIPNERLISTEVINITKFPIRRLDIKLSVSYESDLAKVKKTLIDVATNNPFCLIEPEPFVLITDFADSGIEFLLGLWIEKTDYVVLKNSIMIEIIDAFRSEDIEIPYPHVKIVSE